MIRRAETGETSGRKSNRKKESMMRGERAVEVDSSGDAITKDDEYEDDDAVENGESLILFITLFMINLEKRC